LRENVKYMPAYSAYKIYVIDEVHMLSISAFNALLKTLEEPPPHVMFMFATTEPQKIPITILSRCQRHDLRRISIQALCEHLKKLCEKEDRHLEPESIELIAREADGSMRDSLSLLDQTIACAPGTITHERVLDLLGVIDRQIIFDITSAVLNKDIPKLLDIVDEVYDRGHDIKKIYSDIVEHFRNLLVVKIKKQNIEKLVNSPTYEIEQMQRQVSNVTAVFLNQIFEILFKDEISVKLSAQPKLSLEMVFMRLLQTEPALQIDKLIKKLDNLKDHIRENPDKSVNIQETHAPVVNAPEPENKKSGPKSDPIDIHNHEQSWDRVSKAIVKQHPGLTSIIQKSCLKEITAQNLLIEAPGGDYNTDMINNELNNIKDICEKLFGKQIDVQFQFRKKEKPAEHQEKQKNKTLKQKALNHKLVADALEIFNGKILDVKLL